jgi:sugar/nucleoside kinase (ribokinase family)
VERVLVIGDVIDDIIVVPKETIRLNTDTDSSIMQTLGGSASNIASWAASLGADVTLVGCVNRNDEARVQSQFAQYKVKCELQLSHEPTGSLVVLVDGEDRTMLTDRGANKDLSITDLSVDYLSDFAFVLISGYALFDKSSADIQEFIERIQDAGALVLIDPGSAGYIKDYGAVAFRTAIWGTDIFLPNEEEFELLTAEFANVTVVKQASAGVVVYIEGRRTMSLAAEDVIAIDPTGAGDAFAGGFIATLAKGKPLDDAVAVGISTAAKAVTTIGARPQL